MTNTQRLSCERLTVKQGRESQKRVNGIYTWVDEKGLTHFSDTASADAKGELTQYTEPKYSFELEINSIATNPPPFFRNKLTATMQQIDAVYRQYLPKRELQPIKIDLTLAGNLHSYDKLRMKYSNLAAASQGFYSSRHNLAVVWHKSDPQAFKTSIHEAVHVMNSGQFGHTQRWFNEGLAEYFESPSYLMSLDKKVRYELVTKRQLRSAIKQSSKFSLMTLDNLLTASGNDWAGNKRNSLYLHSQHFIAFLMSGQKGRAILAALFHDFSRNRCQNKTPETTLANYSGGLDQLNRDWQRWQKSQQHK
ncbi:DUF4124 domain-containing protein [Shewanella nanhaiensis]|uniref:DUF4124 domain-containing protein n=1 Tax=Shewanella nanhaiensis TaxID=2864872 RepID=A0ABS7E9F0_9GAMM|nr:DUF4124 domain-containing protein [Shewanella nanhaiensis]MBW8186311.1 DUF4124 domain-containing protein [Shewanella nanhaiensis]